MQTVHFQKTVGCDELVMPEEKIFQHIFEAIGRLIVIIILQVLFATHIWGITPDITHFHLGYIQLHGVFRPLLLHASENI